MVRGLLVGLLVVLISMWPVRGAGQGGAADLTGMGGLTTERFDDELPMIPQVGLQASGSYGGLVWVGAEFTTRFMRPAVDCPDVVGFSCSESGPWTTETITSLLLRIEFRRRSPRPYVIALLGREYTNRVVGGGFGLRWDRLFFGQDAFLEARHRDTDRFRTVETDHWEVLFGVSWRFATGAGR